MPPFRIAKLATAIALALPALIGCAGKNTYRLDAQPMVTESRFAIIQNFGTAHVESSRVDALVMEVADLLGVRLRDSVRKVRIVVTSPENIAGLALAINSTPSGKVSAMSAGRYVEALYVPKASISLIPYFDRVILCHELAHYVTDHYLSHTPLAKWEEIADRVEHKLWMTKPVPASPTPLVPSVARTEGASPVQKAPTTEDEDSTSRGAVNAAAELPEAGAATLPDPIPVALAAAALATDVDAVVPVPDHHVAEFDAVVPAPFLEAEGQALVDDADGDVEGLPEPVSLAR